MLTLKVKSHSREELVEITDQVAGKLTESGVADGIVVLYVQHTTAGLTVNENADPDVPRDMLHALRTLIPQHGMGFRHGEENSDAHIKAAWLDLQSPFHLRMASFCWAAGRVSFCVSLTVVEKEKLS